MTFESIKNKAEESRADKSARPDRSKPARIPLGKRDRLKFKGLIDDENYVYRVINDKDDRLKNALEGGYEFINSKEKLDDPIVGEGGAIDSRVSKPVGKGTTGFLMRIKREWYEEDQKLKQQRVDSSEQAMKPKATTVSDRGVHEYGPGLTSE
jgi:hypothetical protein